MPNIYKIDELKINEIFFNFYFTKHEELLLYLICESLTYFKVLRIFHNHCNLMPI